jgi:hypothetical protein
LTAVTIAKDSKLISPTSACFILDNDFNCSKISDNGFKWKLIKPETSMIPNSRTSLLSSDSLALEMLEINRNSFFYPWQTSSDFVIALTG